MNIDVLKQFLSEEDFLSLCEKLKDKEINLQLKDEQKENSLLEEIESLKKSMAAKEKIGIALSNASPVDFSLALGLIDEKLISEDKTAESLVNELKDKHPSLFKDYFKKDCVTTALPHSGNLPDKDSLNDKDYYDLLFQKNK